MVKTTTEKSADKSSKAATDDKPKKPKTAYMLWLAENRDAITAKGFKGKEVMKEAGVQWKVIDDKSKWVKQAAEERTRLGLPPVVQK
jgi:hypothetical protein